MEKQSKKPSARRISVCALLLALMLVLGYAESLLPSFSIPGMKIGLSNSILLFSVYMLNIPTAFGLMVLKVVLSGMMFGGVSAMMYALAGGVLSMIVMCLLSHFKDISPIVVSVAGGAMHNVGQVALAMLLLHTDQLLYYMAVLILVGMACGALTGFCAIQVMKHLKHIRLN